MEKSIRAKKKESFFLKVICTQKKGIREVQVTDILSENIVSEDIMLIEEGIKMPADGFVIKVNDKRVDESYLTGEAEALWKTPSNS